MTETTKADPEKNHAKMLLAQCRTEGLTFQLDEPYNGHFSVRYSKKKKPPNDLMNLIQGMKAKVAAELKAERDRGEISYAQDQGEYKV